MDRLTPEQRHKNMVSNKSRNTSIELILGRLLWNSGVRYRKNDKRVFGHPDFSVPRYMIAIFCDGEFWHGRNWDTQKDRIKSNRDFWYSKIERNIAHDRTVTAALESQGWTVVRFWETDLRRQPDMCLNEVLRLINEKKNHSYRIIPPYEETISCAAEQSEPYSRFSYVSLYSGIGSFRLALDSIGGSCLFSSEWNLASRITYLQNFGQLPHGDITDPSVFSSIPDHFDILCSQLPRQRFLFTKRSLDLDSLCGTHFHTVALTLQQKQPKAFIFECSRNITTFDKGMTFDIILKILREKLGYFVPAPQLLNALDFGLPHDNPRLYIVGFRNDLGITGFKYPEPSAATAAFSDIRENDVPDKYYLTQQNIQTLMRNNKKAASLGFEIIPEHGVAHTLFDNRQSQRRNLLTDDIHSYHHDETTLRRLTPREYARLQGIPDDFSLISDDQIVYDQISSSCTVPVIKILAEMILRHI